MAKRMLIDATHTEETRAVVVSGNRLEEFDFESTTKTQLKGNIYLAKVTRVEPSLQAAFVDYGGNRHGFLAFSEIHPDYYRIPVADREALLAEVSSQEDDIDIDDSGVEEIDDDDGMNTTSPHDDDGVLAANDEASDDSQLEEEPDAEDEPSADATADIGEHALAGETAAADDVDVTEAHSSESDNGSDAPAESSQNDEPSAAGDEEGEADDSPKPWYARMDQEDIVVRGKKEDAEGDEDGPSDGADDAPADGENDAGTAQALDAARQPTAPSAVNDTDTDEFGDDAAGGESAAETVDAEADGSETADATVEATSETVGDSNETPERETSRGPSARRRRGRGRRDRDVESVGGEDSDELDRSKSWHRRYRIQEVISRRQILLVQVAKEERGNKGAALTTYISLAGRYCVLMPNTPRGGGISRKIANPKDRRKLKEIVGGLNIPSGMAVIVRTAGAQRTKAEIRRDYEYLLKLWDEIRERTLQSTAPSLIHEEANLIKRSIRDLYSKDIDEVLVEGDEGYKTAKAFMKLLMPSHAKRVKVYKEEAMPLFHRYQVEQQIDNIYSPTVQLKSGGYIVMNATEALVAIDVNSGRATRERNIEETAYRTNLEAADEIARQLRLRDLAGLIVIDFIDMEEGRNRYNVERRLKEAMKHDRARIQLGRISAFGLLEMSRQRLRPSIAEISAQPCPTCGGSGVVRSIESSALQILRAIEEEGMRQRTKSVTVSMPSEVAFYIMNNKRAALAEIESRYELDVFLRGDDNLVPPEHELEVGDVDGESEAAPPRSRKKSDDADEGERGKKRRRRRRSRSGDDEDSGSNAAETESVDADQEDRGDPDNDDKGDKRGSRRRGRRGGRKRKKAEVETTENGTSEDRSEDEDAATADSPATDQNASENDGGDGQDRPRRRRRRRGSGRTRKPESETDKVEVVGSSENDDAGEPAQAVAEGASESDGAKLDTPPASPEPAPTPEPAAAESAVSSPEAPAPESVPEPASGPADETTAPQKRRGGWWSFGKNGD